MKDYSDLWKLSELPDFLGFLNSQESESNFDISKAYVYWLPNEIIADIFRLVCAPHTSSKQHRVLAQVSQRFRDVAEGMQELWTFYSLAQSGEWWELQNTRNGQQDLHIHYTKMRDIGIEGAVGLPTRSSWCPGSANTGQDCACLRFLACVVPQCHRWATFSFRMYHGDSTTRGRLKEIFRDLNLPRLTRLEIAPHQVTSLQQDQTEVCGTWIMPNLRHLIGTEGSLIPRLLTIVPAHLKTLSIRASFPIVQPHFYNECLKLASEGPRQIRALSLTFDGVPARSDELHPSALTTHTFYFPNLQFLYLNFNWRDTKQPFKTILRHLLTPRLEVIVARFDLLFPDRRQSNPFKAFGSWLAAAMAQTGGLKDLYVIVRKGQDRRVEDENDVENGILQYACGSGLPGWIPGAMWLSGTQEWKDSNARALGEELGIGFPVPEMVGSRWLTYTRVPVMKGVPIVHIVFLP